MAWPRPFGSPWSTEINFAFAPPMSLIELAKSFLPCLTNNS